MEIPSGIEGKIARVVAASCIAAGLVVGLTEAAKSESTPAGNQPASTGFAEVFLPVVMKQAAPAATASDTQTEQAPTTQNQGPFTAYETYLPLIQK